jgi:hypothetical protein
LELREVEPAAKVGDKGRHACRRPASPFDEEEAAASHVLERCAKDRRYGASNDETNWFMEGDREKL